MQPATAIAPTDAPDDGAAGLFGMPGLSYRHPSGSGSRRNREVLVKALLEIQTSDIGLDHPHQMILQ